MFFKEIELIKPDLIITLGGVAYKQLTGKSLKPVTRNLKTEKPRIYKGIRVLPLMHITGSYANHMKGFLEVNGIDNHINHGLAYSELVKYFLK